MPSQCCPLRICEVLGYDGRANDLVYCHPTVRTDRQTTVVYFGGDVQDFKEKMDLHRENKNYSKWNLETTAELMQSHFPDCHVLVIRPSRCTSPKLATFMEYVATEMDDQRMEFKTVSCFDNFVPCNNCGNPDHTPMHYALQHLERILQGASFRIDSMSDAEILAKCNRVQERDDSSDKSDKTVENKPPHEDSDLWWRYDLALDKYDLVLIGFSKGCVVLNQFIYEFHYLKTLTPDDDTMTRFVSRIREMYWLDGGHAGGKNTWITSRSLLETLTRLGVVCHVHVTPYQVMDERRPWIRKEEKGFNEMLQKLGANVKRTLHFENQVASLYTHFDLLTVFREPKSAPPPQ